MDVLVEVDVGRDLPVNEQDAARQHDLCDAECGVHDPEIEQIKEEAQVVYAGNEGGEEDD